jgi:hypothetical protein
LAPNRAPDCAAAVASPGALVPPEKRFVTVGVTGVQDPDGDPLTITVTGISQDEALWHGPCGDGAVVGEAEADLRVVRRERRRGRTYRVTFRADDGRGGQCAGRVAVCVPGTPTSACADDGSSVDSTAPACTGVCAQACSVERTLGHADCGEKLPPKLERLIRTARRDMLRAATGKGGSSQVGAAVKTLVRAARLDDSATKAGRISTACSQWVAQILGDARVRAEQTAQTLTTSGANARVRGLASRPPSAAQSIARSHRGPARVAGSKARRRPPEHSHAHSH